VALIADIAAYLTKIGWNGFGLSATTWVIIMFAIALIIHLLMIWQRHMPLFGLVAVWALIAISVANKLVNSTVYIAAIIAALIVLLNVIVYYIQYRKRLPV
jgi:flagellar biosynthesis protein FlhB